MTSFWPLEPPIEKGRIGEEEGGGVGRKSIRTDSSRRQKEDKWAAEGSGGGGIDLVAASSSSNWAEWLAKIWVNFWGKYAGRMKGNARNSSSIF